jgi:hypothetical protein
VDDADDDHYARAPAPADLVRICRALNEAQARYLLIGRAPQDAIDRAFLEAVLRART